jgi:hypothetical protein
LKKITAAFDGGRITSDGGVMLLAQAERRLRGRNSSRRQILRNGFHLGFAARRSSCNFEQHGERALGIDRIATIPSRSPPSIV